MSLATWWYSARKLVAKARRKGFDTFVWLVAWSIWRERYRHAHDRETLMLVALVPAILDEAKTWARGLPPDCLPHRRSAFEASVLSFFVSAL
jgi:hypothetical protein